jgi:Flp pilus assembly pilin Flp
MVETWRGSWFEEGTRLFYLVPGVTIDAVLPLAISPTPARVARAFVGRVEIITPATIRAVRDAIAEADDATLIEYGRFLGPIADRILALATEAERAQTQAVLGARYQSYLAGAASSCK